MEKVTFYFDGFNFYNGLKSKSIMNPHWKNYYWIDFVKFCEQFIDPNTQVIEKVKYFTAPPKNIGKMKRQEILLNVNKELNPERFKVINGKYINKNIHCKLCDGTFQQSEEKRTDVNLSLELIIDCYENNTDKLVLITADSDIIPPIQKIIKSFPEKKISIFFPPNRFSYDLSDLGRKAILLEKNEKKFINSRLNNIVIINGKEFMKPENWVG